MLTSIDSFISHVVGTNLWNWFIGINAATTFILFHKSLDEITLLEHNREKRKINKLEKKPMDHSSKTHTFVIGTTGSGKTTLLLNKILYAIENKHFVFIFDGKGDLDEYGLLNVVRSIADHNDVKVRVINQSNLNDTDCYRPFENLTATQVHDYLMAIGGPWSEEHFKALAGRYWQRMADIMIRYRIEITFDNLLKYSIPDNLIKLCQSKLIKKEMTKEEYDSIVRIAKSDSGKQTEVTANRIAVIYEGDGRKLFDSENNESFCIRDAYEKNEIVIVLNNRFKHGDFAKALADFVFVELKILVGLMLSHEINTKANIDVALFVFDELSAYIQKDFNFFLAQARSANIKCVLATQTIQDVEREEPKLINQLLGNCHELFVLKTPDPESSEVIAKYIGTETKKESTERSTNQTLTGEASNKVVEVFKLHPQWIRELEPMHCFVFNNLKPNEIKKYKLGYVDVPGIKKGTIIFNKKEYDEDELLLLEKYAREIFTPTNYPPLSDEEIRQQAAWAIEDRRQEQYIEWGKHHQEANRVTNELLDINRDFKGMLGESEFRYLKSHLINQHNIDLKHTQFRKDYYTEEQKIEFLKRINQVAGVNTIFDESESEYPIIVFDY